MPTSYPLPTLAPTVNAAGISVPAYNDILQSLVAIFQGIYGSDIYIASDSQDGQWLAALSQAIYDSNQACVAVFQAFSPSFAQGTGLDSLIKLNGLMRLVPTNSQAVGNVVGVAGTQIANGVVVDESGNLWNLPVLVTIPSGGSIAVTVTSQKAGAIPAPSGSINGIYTPQLGWQSFISTSNATVGDPVETDGALRIRQASSTALAAQGMKESLYANLANLTGVTRVFVYENNTKLTDVNGVPANSFVAIVEGGSVAAIVNIIALQKPPGIQSYGTTSQTVYDQYGLPTVINFDVLTEVPIYFGITIKALGGYVSSTGTAIVNALLAFINSLPIGEPVYTSQCQAVASLNGTALGTTFYLVSFYLGIAPSPSGTANIAIAYNAAAQLVAGNVTVTPT
jgi:uncharacterized phage protein gp47/JayE